MCGILGIYQPEGGFDPAAVERRLGEAAALLAHRGPDACGISLLPEDGVGFGHRRLAILDLDARANQPMASSDGKILLTFNGEIYNFRALRLELEKQDCSFKTESDSEVLIEGYRRWGFEALLSRLAGMFSFALYDAKDKILFLARDRAGKKPLFYSEQEGGLQFCSELRGLLRLSPMPKELDAAGLDAYLSLKFTPSPRTLFKGVSKIPPGHYLQKKGNGAAQIKRYWQPFLSKVPEPSSPEACLERLDSSFAESMKRRMVSDVPVCLFLSGGIDSSLMVSYLARGGFKGMTAYSIGYEDLPAYSEFEYSRLIAERFPIRYEEIELASRDALDVLEDRSLELDEPNADWVWVPLYHLSRRAHQDGFKVALLGEGSDELFFGYDVMMKGLKNIRRFENPRWKNLAALGAGLLKPVFDYSRKGHHRYDLLRRMAEGEPIYLGSSTGFLKSQRHQVAGPRLLAEGDADAGMSFVKSLRSEYQEFSRDAQDQVNGICYTEFYSKMSEMLLQRVDRVTMLHSLEARSPFLDHELVELAFSIRGDWKISGGRLKGLLKDLAARSLPERIINRKKMGFSFPFKEWLRGELGEIVSQTFRESRLLKDGWVNGDYCRVLLEEHRGGRRDHAPRIWMLFDLCRWYDRWMA